MAQHASIDERIEDLRWTTEALLDSADLPEALGALLDTREQHIRALQNAARDGGLTQPQLLKLRNLIETGMRVRKPLVLRKELLKQQLDELRTSKRAQAPFTQSSDSSGQRLNIKL